ncbi:SRPBCC family protein [Cohnella caldifontis]|uniref:SRPBCC family protein n=1 Tax=Cohnella caldifontis TaxID=3027471 RepID=UPI0023EC3279|nr:SRPBCC family protein [Cohnella sp. YIM B05605]
MEYQLTKPPVAKAEMLIRKPAREAFEAIADPAFTTRFWFTKSSGRLEPGKWVEWEWEMYGFSTHAHVLEMEPDRRILLEWGDSEMTTIEWLFTPHSDQSTFVSVTNSGFSGENGDSLVAQAIGSTEGFTFVLAAMKALLEHGIELKVVADRHPGGIGG